MDGKGLEGKAEKKELVKRKNLSYMFNKPRNSSLLGKQVPSRVLYAGPIDKATKHKNDYRSVFHSKTKREIKGLKGAPANPSPGSYTIPRGFSLSGAKNMTSSFMPRIKRSLPKLSNRSLNPLQNMLKKVAS